MLVRFFLCLFFTVRIIHGQTDQEMKAWLFREGLKCNKDNQVTMEEIQMLKKHKMPNTKAAKCFIGCILKKAELLDDQGMFDADMALTKATKIYEGNVPKFENAKKLIENCRKVNSEPVEDGVAGCDRARLMFNCCIDTAKQLGFSVIV